MLQIAIFFSWIKDLTWPGLERGSFCAVVILLMKKPSGPRRTTKHLIIGYNLDFAQTKKGFGQLLGKWRLGFGRKLNKDCCSCKYYRKWSIHKLETVSIQITDNRRPYIKTESHIFHNTLKQLFSHIMLTYPFIYHFT